MSIQEEMARMDDLFIEIEDLGMVEWGHWPYREFARYLFDQGKVKQDSKYWTGSFRKMPEDELQELYAKWQLEKDT